MVGAVPFVGQIVEAVRFRQLVVFKAVPRHKIAHVKRVQLCQLVRRGGLGEHQIIFADAVAKQFFFREAHGNAVFDLSFSRVSLFIRRAAVLKRHVFAVA
ncbi:hypothetical protein SDC9_202412 [bioreactor metagenome]|uniref:Uncharacterized protein n=1 Tax=bioreactor metagenome TaxID=1076179 RepID=A0A645ITI6_9ZZZZ